MFSKKALLTSDESTISFIRFASCLPPLYIMLYLNGIPEIKHGFFLAVILSTPLEILAMFLYNRSIKLSPLSLTLPFLAFTPIFLLVTAHIMIGESPNFHGFIGILLITLGGYLLNIDIDKGFFYPFKAIRNERGSLLMLGVAFLYSITSVFGKIMVEKSDFIFTPAVYFTFVTFVTAIIASFQCKSGLKGVFESKRLHLMVGIFSCLMIVSHFLGLSMIKVEYMISVKRSSMLFGIIYGSIIFKEVEIRKRLFSASIMLIGIILLSAFGS
jgi:drug/metabolite transporter (DMT)-like permease